MGRKTMKEHQKCYTDFYPEYEVLDEKTFKHSTWYQIIDDSGEAYWYPAHFFELVA